MPRRPPFNDIYNATADFLRFLDENGHPDAILRDDVKAHYAEFSQSASAHRRTGTKVPFRFVLRELRVSKQFYEFGDYYVFMEGTPDFDNLYTPEEMKELLQRWRKLAEENPYYCEVCGRDCQNEKNLEEHFRGYLHRIHKLHLDIFKKRDQLFSCPEGVVIETQPDKELLLECDPDDKLTMEIAVGNKHPTPRVLVFQRHVLLWDTGVFKLTDNKGRKVKRRHHLQRTTPVRDEMYRMVVHCNAPKDYGKHFVPLALYFQWKVNGKLEGEEFYVLRYVTLHVLGNLHEELKPTAPYEEPTIIPGFKDSSTVPGTPLPRMEGGNRLTKGKRVPPCKPPQDVKNAARKGLTKKLEPVDETLKRNLAPPLSMETYRDRFDKLLWLEEIQMAEDIRRYDIMNTTLDFNSRRRLMYLAVPGLAERRPSVLKGDQVYIYVDSNREVQYEGIVHFLEEEGVQLGVSHKLESKWTPNKKFDVRFDFSRHSLQIEHRAVSTAPAVGQIIFPKNGKRNDGDVQPISRWYDSSLNTEQQQAVINIVGGTSKPAPYLIFGPPGTGKTVTTTEAIRQVYHGVKSSRILICCPENTAADLIMSKLISSALSGTVQKRDVFRMYALSRPHKAIPEEILESGMCNVDRSKWETFYPSKTELEQYRIIIVTLISAGRLVTAAFSKNFFTHVFIDEAGHAVEPECIVPIAGLLNTRDGQCGQLVLAGDPKQLGPVLRSPFALKYGLDVSLLERLMTDNPNYQRQDKGVPYDSGFLTKLVRNYRSHNAILVMPRELFYDNELVQSGDNVLLTSMIGWEHLPNKDFPIIFHAVFGNDEREANSPSFFNRDEVAQVDKYLNLLLNEKKRGQKLKGSEIGIISPYRKQVLKIRQMINQRRYANESPITVGSVEEFQGQERKVIIISTVRTVNHDEYIGDDITFKMGFLKNPKRFNVAITRARVLLIVIGNPILLGLDDNWKRFLQYCEENGGFKGTGAGKRKPPGSTRQSSDEAVARLRKTVDGLEKLEITEATTSNKEMIYKQTVSMRQDQEEPEWQIRD